MTMKKKTQMEDIVKAIKAVNREVYGFQPTRIQQSKKIYKRKEGKKVVID